MDYKGSELKKSMSVLFGVNDELVFFDDYGENEVFIDERSIRGISIMMINNKDGEIWIV